MKNSVMTDPQQLAWFMGAFDCEVKQDWIDENNHLDAIHYKTVADVSHREIFRQIGLTDDYFASRVGTVFQLELHICFERELVLGDPLELKAWIIGFDEKRIHHFHEIFHRERGYRAGTVELMSIHINCETRRSAPFAASVIERLNRLPSDHGMESRPSRVSSRIGLQRP